MQATTQDLWEKLDSWTLKFFVFLLMRWRKSGRVASKQENGMQLSKASQYANVDASPRSPHIVTMLLWPHVLVTMATGDVGAREIARHRRRRFSLDDLAAFRVARDLRQGGATDGRLWRHRVGRKWRFRTVIDGAKTRREMRQDVGPSDDTDCVEATEICRDLAGAVAVAVAIGAAILNGRRRHNMADWRRYDWRWI